MGLTYLYPYTFIPLYLFIYNQQQFGKNNNKISKTIK